MNMVQTVFQTFGFYYSATYDVTHTLQRLENTTPEFKLMHLNERVRVVSSWSQHAHACRQTDRWTDRQKDRQVDRQTDRRMDRWTDRQTDGQRQTEKQTNKLLYLNSYSTNNNR